LRRGRYAYKLRNRAADNTSTLNPPVGFAGEHQRAALHGGLPLYFHSDEEQKEVGLCGEMFLSAGSLLFMDETADTSDAVILQPPATALTGTTAEASDVELVAQVRDGDESAFEELFNRHRRRVALIAGRFFRQPEQIEEVVQESFTKAYFALGDFANEQEASFASWLARIAFNCCYDELRRIKRRPESSMSNVSEEEASRLKEQLRADGAGDDIESATIARDLAGKLLARLSPEDRMVLVMLDVEGMSVAEIAESTRWSISKIKVRAHRARGRLRRVLKKFL
jgi:RNA polymerase sigma-70 factor (ECF subfamily)